MNRNIKDRLMITKIGISLIVGLIAVSCTKPLEQDSARELSYTYEKYEDGSAKEIGMKKDSMKVGLWITFYPNGKIRGIEFFNDNQWNGPWYYFHGNGQLSFYRGTKNGGFHGEGYDYYDNGVFAGNVNFIEDKQDGIFESYDEEGNLWMVNEYKDGEYVKTLHGPGPIPE